MAPPFIRCGLFHSMFVCVCFRWLNTTPDRLCILSMGTMGTQTPPFMILWPACKECNLHRSNVFKSNRNAIARFRGSINYALTYVTRRPASAVVRRPWAVGADLPIALPHVKLRTHLQYWLSELMMWSFSLSRKESVASSGCWVLGATLPDSPEKPQHRND